MNRRNRNWRRVDYVLAAVAFVGFLLTLTEKDGGAWAGTFVGTAMLLAGAVPLLRAKIILKRRNIPHDSRMV